MRREIRKLLPFLMEKYTGYVRHYNKFSINVHRTCILRNVKNRGFLGTNCCYTVGSFLRKCFKGIVLSRTQKDISGRTFLLINNMYRIYSDDFIFIILRTNYAVWVSFLHANIIKTNINDPGTCINHSRLRSKKSL